MNLKIVLLLIKAVHGWKYWWKGEVIDKGKNKEWTEA